MAIRYDIMNQFREYMEAENAKGVSIFEITGSKIVDGREVKIYAFKPEFLAKFADTYDKLFELSEEEIAEKNSTLLPDDTVAAARLEIEALHKDSGYAKYSEGQLRSLEIMELMNPFADPQLNSDIDMLQSTYAYATRELLLQKYFGADLGASLSSHEFMIARDSFKAHLDNVGKLNNYVHNACVNDPLYREYLKSEGFKAQVRARRKEARSLKRQEREENGNSDDIKEKRGIIKGELGVVRDIRRGRRYANRVQMANAVNSAYIFTAKHWNNLKKKTKAFFGIKDSPMAKLINGGPIPSIFIAASLETLGNALENIKKNPPVVKQDKKPELPGFIVKNGDQYSFVPYTVYKNNLVVKGDPQPIEKSQLSIEQLNQAELGIANIEIDVVGPGGAITTQKVPHVVDPAVIGGNGVPVVLEGDHLFAYNYARLTGMPRPKDKSYIIAANEMSSKVTISGTAEQKAYEVVRRREFARMLTQYEMGQNESLNDSVSELINSQRKEFEEFKKSSDRVFEDEATAQFAFYYHITDADRAIPARPATSKEKLKTGDNLAIVSCDENGKNAQYVHFKFDAKNGTFIISDVYDANATKRTRGVKNISPEQIAEVRQSMQEGVITINHDGETYSFVKGVDENGRTTYQPYEEFKQTPTYLSTVVLANEFDMFRKDGQTLVEASREFMGTASAVTDQEELDRIERRQQIVASYSEFISDDLNLLEAEQFMKDNMRWYEASKDRYKDMPEDVRLFRFKWDREHDQVDPILEDSNNLDNIVPEDLQALEEEDIALMGDDDNPEYVDAPTKKPVPSGIEDLAGDALWLDMYQTIGQMKEPNSELPMIGTVVLDILRVASKQDAHMDPEKRKARMQEILVDTYTNHAMKELIENFHLIKAGKETEIVSELTKHGINLEELGVDFSKFNRRQCEKIARALADKKYEAIVDRDLEEIGMARVTLVELSKGKYNNAQGIDWANVQIREGEDGGLRIDGRRDSKFYRALVQSGIEFNREKYEAAIRDEIAANIDLRNEATSPDANIVTLELEDKSEIRVVQIDKDGVTVYITQENPPKIIETEEISPDNTLININDVVQAAANGREKIELEQRKANARVSEKEEKATYAITR